jgi:hypothetical protein
MEQFKIRPDGFKELKKKTLWRGVILLIVAVTVGILSVVISFKNTGTEIDLSLLPIMIPIIACAVGVGIYRGLNRQKILFESYLLTFSDNQVTREQFNTTTLSLHAFEIKEIVKDKRGNFWIKANDIIIVPAQVEKYEELTALLNKIVPVTTTVSIAFKYRNVVAVIALGLMFCLYSMTNKIIVGISGALLTGIFVWSIYQRWKYRNSIDKKTQRSFFVYILLLFVIIATTVLKLL